MTYCSQTSFDNRLSERNDPPGSDRSMTSFQNSASDKRSGRPAGAGAAAAVVDAAAGGGAAGAVAGGACFAHETGVAAINSASDQAQTNRFDMLTGSFRPRSRIVTESSTSRRRRVSAGASLVVVRIYGLPVQTHARRLDACIVSRGFSGFAHGREAASPDARTARAGHHSISASAARQFPLPLHRAGQHGRPHRRHRRLPGGPEYHLSWIFSWRGLQV